MGQSAISSLAPILLYIIVHDQVGILDYKEFFRDQTIMDIS